MIENYFLAQLHRIWPIQLSSPTPVQYKIWCKHFDAAQWGMGVWSEEELWAAYNFILFFVLPSSMRSYTSLLLTTRLLHFISPARVRTVPK